MTISGELLAPGGNTPSTFQNINADAVRLGNGGTVLGYLKQVSGDLMTYAPYPGFDGILQVMDPQNRVLRSISLVDDLLPAGRFLNDMVVERLANGGFVVAWSDADVADINWQDVRVRYAIYDDNGSLVSRDVLSTTAGFNVRITSLADGGFATVFAANTAAHSQQGVVNTFNWNAGSYVKAAESYVGDPNAPAPGANADVTKLFMFDEFSISGLSDGGFVVGAPTYDWVNSNYTPLGDFVFRYAAGGAQQAFASGNYWQRVNWNDGQVNNAVLTKAFAGGFASVNRGKDGNWQVTMFNNDGSLITTTQQTEQVYRSGVYDTRTYHATDITPVVAWPGQNYLNYDQFIDIAEINGELVVVVPNAGKGFDLVRLSKADGTVLSVSNMGIAVPQDAVLMNPRILAEGSGYDLTYDVMSINGDNYYLQSTYQIGLGAPPNLAPQIDGLDGDATDFILGTAQYIDNNVFADVADADSADFDGGYLEVLQVAGAADGDFSFDLLLASSQFLWGSGAQPDTANDGTSFIAPGPMVAGDKVWYNPDSSLDPADWILAGTVTSDGQDGASLKITFNNPALAVPSALLDHASFAAAMITFLMYTAPTLGARSFELRIADGDGAVSLPASFDMTGTSDQSSTIAPAAGVTEPVTLPTNVLNQAGAVGVFDFTVTDAGDADGLATRIDALSLQVAGSGDFTKVTWLLTGPGLGAPVQGVYHAGSGTLDFASAIAVADGAAAVYTVKAYFNTTSGVTAGATYLLSLDGDSGVTLANGMSSQMANGQSPVTTGSGIVVVAGPGVTSVDYATPAASPTNADSLSWTVRFSEAVSSIDAADFDVAGLSGETITVAAAGANTYTVTASGGGLASLNGSATLALAAGQDIVNGAGMALASLAPSGTDQRSYLIDNSAPAAPSQPDLASASDSGSSTIDNRTRIATPTFTGSAEAGALVELVDANGTVLGSGIATAGAWSITVSALGEGNHTISARASDAAGNTGLASSGLAVIIDTSVALPTLALHADTGSAAGDGRSNDGRIDAGLAADVASWEYSTDSGISWTAGSGAGFVLAEGSYAAGVLRLRQTDMAGNTSAVATNGAAIVIDHTLAAPALALAADTGASAADGISSAATVNVTLAADVAGWEYRSSSNGAWNVGSGTSFVLAEGSYAQGEVQVRQTDTAGNTSSAATNGAAIVIDLTVAAPGLALASDTGSSAADGVSSAGTVSVSLAPDVASWEYRSSSVGAWSAGSGTSFVLAEGSYAQGEVQVRQVDTAGNTSSAGVNGTAILIDQTAPAAPGLALANDTGANPVDGVSNDGTVDVVLANGVSAWEYRSASTGAWTTGSGTSFVLAAGSYAPGEVQVRQLDSAGNTSSAASNAAALEIVAPPAAPGMALASDTGASAADGITADGTVAVTLAAGAVAWEYRSSASGAWSAGSGTSFTLAPGAYAAGAVQVRQVDNAGNTSAVATNGAALVVDGAAPVVGAVTRATVASPSANQAIVVAVRYDDAGAGIDAATVDTADITVSGPGAGAGLAVSAASWNAATGIAQYTLDAPAGGWNAVHAGNWSIAMAAGAVLDLAGNALAGGVAHQFAVSFNTAPMITTNGGGASAAIDVVEGLRAVTTVQASDAGDTLAYSISGGLDAALFEIDAASGVLRLRSAQAAASPADSDANGSYLVNVTATDGAGASDTQALTITVLRDTDRDGVADILDPDLDGDGRLNSAEDPVPSAHGGATGDGNGDGIADSTQANVASLATVGSVAADKRFATIAVADGLTLVGVSNSAAPAGLPRNAKMPLGQFDFEVRGLAVGATVDIDMYVDKTLSANGYYKQTASGWVNLATVSTVGGKTKLSFSLTDGGAYDADGIANGVIVDPGGAAVIAPRIVSAGGEPSGTVLVRENLLAVTTVQAEALGPVVYAITGGADAARFTLDAASGALAFASAPDFEYPQDAGDGAANNTYVVEVTALGAAGSDTQVLTVRVQDVDESTPPVDDGDSIPASTEQAVPSLPGANGAPGVAGDGNGDGLADSKQANVTSLPFLHTDRAQSNPGSAPPVYLTLVANSVDGKVATGAGAATVLKDVKQLDAPADKPADLALPLGQISFAAEVATAGASENFSIYVDGAIPINGYWKQNAAGTWVNLADAAHGGKVVLEGGRVRLDFTLVDGGEFDDDGKADGMITDPGAPGYRAPAAGPDSDDDQFPDALEAGHGLVVGPKDNDVFGSNKLFVMELYRDLLFREAAAPEWTHWQGVLDSGAMGKAGLVSTFLDSVEFQGGAGALVRLYLAAFDRLPDGAGLAFWTGQVGAGQPLAALAQALSSSAEFTATHGQLDDAGFVRQLYQNVLGRQGDIGGVAFWTAQLGGSLERGDVLLGFAQSAEFTVASDHAVTAAMGYLGLLERDPAPQEVDFWTGKLDADVPETIVIGAFLATPEYHDRFLP
ncbi:choice-of-anchor U domain-containing protein [Massilia yuzhufengensis]|uniref:Cadherin domain-containing protein n=1 Tax=Massilia yuzhufengensis TaxID=1164594 RepID=A0A1I1I0Z3_9BURK|nr:choice-of-anchor U domain-containing protein [Massilia yuzhufengensis]SFC27888.1 protein of unknown function [Massilia yuzhufengensis]